MSDQTTFNSNNSNLSRDIADITPQTRYLDGKRSPWLRNMLAQSVTIKADPAALNTKASAIETQLGQLKRLGASLERRIQNTEGYWVGDAADLHRRLYTQLKPGADEMLQAIAQHVQNLRDIAQVYQTAEEHIKTQNASLPSDAIE